MSNVIIALLSWTGKAMFWFYDKQILYTLPLILCTLRAQNPKSIHEKECIFMPKKKLAPPIWDEKNHRWKKTAYCNSMSKTFYSTKKGATSAEREITVAINAWKEKMDGLTGSGHLTPMSKVKDVYEDFKLDIESRTSKANWHTVEWRFERWILPVIGKRSILDLNDGLIQKVINNAYTQGNLSRKTLLNMRADIAAFLKFCRKNQLTSYRSEDVDIPKSATRKEKRILQPEQLKVLFSVDTSIINNKRVQEPYIYAFRLQVLHCLRPGEVGGLKKSDRIGDIVHIQRSINSEKEIIKGKNDNAIRAFQLSTLGKECWDKQAALSDSEWMFPGFITDSYRKRLRAYCLSNNIPVISPYELRHTSFSIMQALPEGLVKAAGGHSKNMDTFGIYGHEVQGDMELTAQLLEERFDSLLSNSENQGQNKVNLQNEQKENPNKPHN